MRFVLDWKKIELAEDVTLEIAPLTVPAYQKLLLLVGSFGGGGTQNDQVQQLSNEKIVEVASEIFPKFTKNLTGIELERNGEIKLATSEDLYTESVLLQYAVIVLSELLMLSTVGNQDAKVLKKT